MTWHCNSNVSDLTQHILQTDNVERGKNHESLLRRASAAIRAVWLATELHGAVDGLVLEAYFSSVNSLLEDGVSLHRGHIS